MKRVAGGLGALAVLLAAFAGCSSGPAPSGMTDTFTFHVIAVKGQPPGTISDD